MSTGRGWCGVRKWTAGAMVAAVALLVAACSAMVHLEVGKKVLVFHAELTAGGLPPNAKPVNLKATYTFPVTGRTVEIKLYDTDGNGDPDHGVLPDGSVYEGEVVPAGPQSLSSLTPGVGVQGSQRSSFVEKPFEFVGYHNPPDDPMPVHFVKTVDQYLAEYGLDAIGPGENAAANAIELIGADLDASLPSGFSLDVRLHWNTEAGWPLSIQDFPSLQYEFYGLADVPGTWPHYVEARVVGDSGAVFNWLAHFGVTEIHAANVSITGTPSGDHYFNHVGVVIDEDAGLAQVALDSTTMTVQLGW